MFSKPHRFAAATALTAVFLPLVLLLSGCESGFDRIDRRVDALLADSSEDLGGGARPPRADPPRTRPAVALRDDPTRLDLPTVNPAPDELDFAAIEPLEIREPDTPLDEDPEPLEPDDAIDDELEPDDALRFTLEDALAFAVQNSRGMRFAEEEYLLSALRLLIERHRWGPRFFNETSAIVFADGDDGLFDTSLQLINEFGVTHRLPYGGEVSARALARASQNLHRHVAGQNTQSIDLILSADIPLLRGAGAIAREDRIQAERDLVYGARNFERFRREFLFDIATGYLDLVVLQQGIENARRSVESLEWMEERSRELVRVGRETPLDLALSEQQTLFARDRLNSQIETYRLAVDRFKLRLGMPEDQPLLIEPDELGLPTPDISPEEATRFAHMYRLDLQNQRDQLDDARRNVVNAKNLLLPDLDVFGEVAMPTNPRRDRSGIDFSPGDTQFEAGVTFALPLDREIERVNVRQAQIQLERSIRDYNLFRDSVAIEIRGTVRTIDRARFSLRLQEENVRIAERRMEAIDAAPDRATARDRTEAVNDLLQAQDERDIARRDLQVAILEYLLDSGQLRVNSHGMIEPLRSMEFEQAIQPAHGADVQF